MPFRTLAAALLAAAIFAVPAEARPWEVRTVPTRGPAFHRDVDVLPDGRTALLIERRVRRRNRLELRLGGRIRTLEVSRHTFISALDHDGNGRLLVAWAVNPEPDGPRQLFTWTARGGKRQMSSSGGVNTLSLDVAPDHSAVLAFWTANGIFVLRRPAEGDFAPTEVLAPNEVSPLDDPSFPVAGVASGGRSVVAWRQRGAIVTRASPGVGPFGLAHAVPLRPAESGGALLPGIPRIAMTSDGRAVVALSSAERRGEGPELGSRVEAFDWAAGASAPSPARVLSRQPFADHPALLARGKTVILAWPEREAIGAPRTLESVFWGPQGLGRRISYRHPTERLGALVVLSPLPGTGARVFYRVQTGRWYTLRLTEAGAGESDRVTPRGEVVVTLDAAGVRRRSVAAWTVRRGRTNAGWRVQTGRPARGRI